MADLDDASVAAHQIAHKYGLEKLEAVAGYGLAILHAIVLPAISPYEGAYH